MDNCKESTERWYLVRTKQYKERWVGENLARFVPETFLPLARTQVYRYGRKAFSISPLFPCYLFARFDLEFAYYKVQRTVGVISLVCNGNEPAEVDCRIIAEIKSRAAADGIVELTRQSFAPGQTVYVTDGPLRGFEAVFDSYMSGPDRITVLLASVRANVRLVLPSAQVRSG